MDLKLDDDHDLAIENNAVVLVSGAQEVRQRLIERLLTFQGEWFLDTTIGVPYYQDILKKAVDAAVIEAIFKTEIIETPGILELLDFDTDYSASTRQFDVAFVVRSTTGEVSVQLTVP
jgi:hypothetical protein